MLSLYWALYLGWKPRPNSLVEKRNKESNTRECNRGLSPELTFKNDRRYPSEDSREKGKA